MLDESPGPLQHIRSHPDMYLPHGRVSGPDDLAIEIIAEALRCTHNAASNAICCLRYEQWWLLVAEADWLIDQRDSIENVFTRIVSSPKTGQNGFYREVRIGAFAEDYFTSEGSKVTFWQGSYPDSGVMSALSRLLFAVARVVGFRLPANGQLCITS